MGHGASSATPKQTKGHGWNHPWPMGVAQPSSRPLGVVHPPLHFYFFCFHFFKKIFLIIFKSLILLIAPCKYFIGLTWTSVNFLDESVNSILTNSVVPFAIRNETEVDKNEVVKP
jgi:hypothetical protein